MVMVMIIEWPERNTGSQTCTHARDSRVHGTVSTQRELRFACVVHPMTLPEAAHLFLFFFSLVFCQNRERFSERIANVADKVEHCDLHMNHGVGANVSGYLVTDASGSKPKDESALSKTTHGRWGCLSMMGNGCGCTRSYRVWVRRVASVLLPGMNVLSRRFPTMLACLFRER